MVAYITIDPQVWAEAITKPEIGEVRIIRSTAMVMEY